MKTRSLNLGKLTALTLALLIGGVIGSLLTALCLYRFSTSTSSMSQSHPKYHLQGISLSGNVWAKAIVDTADTEKACIYRIYYFWWTCYDAVKEGPDNSRNQGWSSGGSSFQGFYEPSALNQATGINWRFDPFHLALNSAAIVLECLGGRMHAVLIAPENELVWSWGGDLWGGGRGWVGPE